MGDTPTRENAGRNRLQKKRSEKNESMHRQFGDARDVKPIAEWKPAGKTLESAVQS